MKPNKHVGSNFNEFIEEEKKRDPEFAKAFDEQIDRLELARTVRELREKMGLSQEELAAKVGTQQPGIARLESGRVVPTLEMLHKIALATGRKLEVRFSATARKRA
jgi:ribosome-binding protein aMBF1 (putative translation factor)